jgi:hypothetical protein
MHSFQLTGKQRVPDPKLDRPSGQDHYLTDHIVLEEDEEDED